MVDLAVVRGNTVCGAYILTTTQQQKSTNVVNINILIIKLQSEV